MKSAINPEPRLEALLRRRGAWFDGAGLCMDQARRRSEATRLIAESFPSFEIFRRRISEHDLAAPSSPNFKHILSALINAAVLNIDDGRIAPTSADARRYLSGGWLEEYAGLAIEAAGAHETRIGQRLGWMAKGFKGVNEVDAIARFDRAIIFVSAKALRPRLEDGDDQHRERLMEALQEADNLVDHFGEPNSAVFLLVTTGLFDRRREWVRYEQLHGKAAALGVELIGLEDIGWTSLVQRFSIFANRNAKASR